MASLYSLDQRFSLVLDCYKSGLSIPAWCKEQVLLQVHFMAGLNRFLIRDMMFLLLQDTALLISRKL